MNDSKKVDAYIKKNSQWSENLSELRSVFQSTELKEEIKWGAPSYTINGKLIASMAGFKNHMALWFYQGVFLKDSHQKLINAQEGKTSALRQWRIDKNDKIEPKIVADYIQEAIENCLAGKEIKPNRKIKELKLNPLFDSALKLDSELKEAFYNLTPGKQRDYANHISEAKREATQQSRLEKCIPLIKAGGGLYDKYKNC